jgi:uncharacterized protein YajQ (UPF0234 family)
MSKEQNSFDVVSKVETQEVNNAVSQAMKEISTRFDFKGSKSNITFDGKEEIVLVSDDEQKLKSVVDILKEKLIKRKVALNALNYEKVQRLLEIVRQVVKLQQGIPSEKAKEIVKIIKNSKLRKVQASIQADQVRITSPSRDELQEVIKMLKESEARLAIPLQYINYRSN